MSTSALFNEQARNALVTGANLVADAVKVTLGPKGNTVVMQRERGEPIITKDGITVAKHINPKDERVAIGAQLVRSVSQKAVDEAGDGTTTASVLAQAIIKEGLKYVTSNANLTDIRRGIEDGVVDVINALKELATPIENDEQLVHVATISANGDEKLGKIVAKAFSKVGKDGVVTVEESKDRDISLEFTEGVHLDRGWTSQFFVTNKDTNTVEFDNPAILLCDSKITNLQMVANILQTYVAENRPVVLIAESFDPQVTDGLVFNVLRSGIKIACIEAPGYGERRKDILRDLGIYLNATVGDDPLGVKFETMTTADLGSCEKIIIKKDETIIRGGHGDKDKIAERVKEIQTLINNTDVVYEKEKLKERLGSLTTGVACIRVGGSSEVEIKELRDRLDDAMWSVKSALEEGFVPGGGRTLAYLSNSAIYSEPANYDRKLGLQILKEAMKAPFKTILHNANENGDVLLAELKNEPITVGYNVATMEKVDLVEAGIIDAAKVVRSAIQAAASIAGLVLTTNVVITNDPVKDQSINISAGVPGMPGII